MIDTRFFDCLGPFTVGELASRLGLALGSSSDPARAVTGCAALDIAGPDDLSFCVKAPADGLIQTGAGAVIVRPGDEAAVPPGTAALLDPAPRSGFARAAALLVRLKTHGHQDPLIHPDAHLEQEVRVLPGVVLGAGAAVGTGTVLGAGCIIGPGVQIGRNCRIGAGVVIQCTLIGDRVTIGANGSIGDSGFGVAPSAEGLIDVPQLGRVIIQDDVSIGALVAVDRGALGDTIIGLGTKIDNLCQIAHNVRIGRNVIIAGFSGVSGSTVLEDQVMTGGRVGFADHLHIGRGAQLAAGAGVINDVPAGETWGGYPAKPRREWVRELASLKRLAQPRAKPET